MKIIDSFLITSKQAPLLKYHQDRSIESLKYFHPQLDVAAVEKLYRSVLEKSPVAQKIKARIEFNIDQLDQSPIEYQKWTEINQPVMLVKAPRCLNTEEKQIARYKTNQRQHWIDWAGLPSTSTDTDVLAYNSDGHITETAKYNVYCIQNFTAFTPPLDDGCLNGVLRKKILEDGFIQWNQKKIPVVEKSVHLDQIEQFEIIVGNSVRGLMQARLLD